MKYFIFAAGNFLIRATISYVLTTFGLLFSRRS